MAVEEAEEFLLWFSAGDLENNTLIRCFSSLLLPSFDFLSILILTVTILLLKNHHIRNSEQRWCFDQEMAVFFYLLPNWGEAGDLNLLGERPGDPSGVDSLRPSRE